MIGNTLREKILAAIIYADLFDYPLTAGEIQKYVGGDLFDIYTILEGENMNLELISQSQGFYFLKGRDECVKIRHERYAEAEKKFRRALFAARILKHIPFVKFAAVCNNLANSNAKKDADIDFFISVQDGKMYTARFLITAIISALRLRRHDKKVIDRICLSFYLTPSAYDLSRVKIIDDDIHLGLWSTLMMPLFNQKEFDEFASKNLWINNFAEGYLPKFTGNRRRVNFNYQRGFVVSYLEKMLSGRFGDWLEKTAKKVQHYKFSTNMASVSVARDTRVVISDSMLKFHEKDRRLLYREKLYEKFELLNSQDVKLI